MAFKSIYAELNELLAHITDAQRFVAIPKIIYAQPSEYTKMADWCNYNGKRVRLLSKNYQTGEAVLEDRDVTGPYTLTVKLGEVDIENPKAGNKCTCGVDSVGGDKHSDYCDKYFSWRP